MVRYKGTYDVLLHLYIFKCKLIRIAKIRTWFPENIPGWKIECIAKSIVRTLLGIMKHSLLVKRVLSEMHVCSHDSLSGTVFLGSVHHM